MHATKQKTSQQTQFSLNNFAITSLKKIGTKLPRTGLRFRELRKNKGFEENRSYRMEWRKNFNKKGVPVEEKIQLQLEMQARRNRKKFARDTSMTRQHKSCLITGRNRGKIYYKLFPFSRLTLLELARAGLLPGVRKASNA